MPNYTLVDLENSILCEKKIFLSDKQYNHEELYNLIIRSLSQYNKLLMNIKKYINQKNYYVKEIENIIKEKNKIIEELSQDINNLQLIEETFHHDVENYSDKIENLYRKNKEIQDYHDNNYLYILYFYIFSMFYFYNMGCNGTQNVLYATYNIFLLTPIIYIADILNVMIFNPILYFYNIFSEFIHIVA